MSSPDMTTIADVLAPGARRKRRRPPKLIDGRSAAARRSRDLAASFERELGAGAMPSERLAINRAAGLAVLADTLRQRRLAGDVTVLLDDLVRVERLADRAVRALGLGKIAKPTAPSLAEYLAAKAAKATEASA